MSRKSMKFLKCMTVILAVFISIALMTVSCKKGNDTAGTVTTAKSTTATSTASKTATSTTSKPATGTATSSTVSEATRTASQEASLPEEIETVSEEQDNTYIESDEDTTEPGKPDTYEIVLDLKGRVINAIVHVPTLVPTLEPGNFGGPKLYLAMKEAEEKFNCKFDIQVLNNENTIRTNILNATMAGVYYTDMVRINRANIFLLEKSKSLLPINDYIDMESDIFKQFEDLHCYGLVYPENIYQLFQLKREGPGGCWYNNEILSREGIPDLKEYARAGQWNWNTFVDVMIKLTKDFDGDGIIDQWGCGCNSFTNFALYMLRSNGGKMIGFSEEEKTYKLMLDQPNAIRALEFISDLFHVYKVVPNKNALNDFLNGKVAVYIYPDWQGIYWQNNYNRRDFRFVTLPRGPDYENSNEYIANYGGSFFVYLSNIDKPEEVVRASLYWLILWDPSKSQYMSFREMTELEASRYFTNEDDIEYFLDFMDSYNVSFECTSAFPPSSTRFNTAVINEIANQRRSPAGLVDTFKAEIENIIYETLQR